MAQGTPPEPSQDPAGFALVGGPVDEVRVALRVMGDDLDPDEVSRLLGCQPTMARRKGEVVPGKVRDRVWQSGIWTLGRTTRRAAIEEEVRLLLAAVTDDLGAWRELCRRFRMDVFCGVFMEDWNRGFELSPATMKLLSERGLAIGFDIYATPE